MHDHCFAALDGGKVECVVTVDGDGTEPSQHPSGNDWDFWFEASARAIFLIPQNRTMFAKAGAAEVTKGGCEAALYKRDRCRIDILPPGSHVCVLTGRGRYAELTLENIAKGSHGPVLVAYTLWE